MIFAKILSNKNLHILHNENYFVFVIENMDYNIMTIDDFLKIYKDYNEKIITNNKIELNIATNFLFDKNIIDLNLINWMFNKDTYDKINYKKYLSFYNNNEIHIPILKICEYFNDYEEYYKNYRNKDFWQFYNFTVLSILSKFNKFIFPLDNYKLLDMNKRDMIIRMAENKVVYDKHILLSNNYNYKTQTLRPSNTLYHFNFMSIPKENRDVFNFEGKIIYELDFKSFHLQILAKYLNLSLPNDYDNWHKYFFENYFKNQINDYNKFKQFIFHLIYGENDDTKGIEFFDKLNDLKRNLYKNFDGYIKTDKIINFVGYNLEPNKIFNYFIQQSEVELVFNILDYAINTLQINIFYYLYDSFYFFLDNKDKLKNLIEFLEKNNWKFRINIYENNLKNKIKTIY